jgi:hypothetical protein
MLAVAEVVGLWRNTSHGTVGAASKKPVANHSKAAAATIEYRVR